MTGPTSAGAAALTRLADPQPQDAADQQHDAVEPLPAANSDRRAYGLPASVLVIGLLVTGVLSWISYGQYNNNEKHLLDLRVREVGTLLSASVPNLQTPLASAAALADATNGDVHRFMRFASPYVGPRPTHQFVSISLWRLGTGQRRPLAIVGTPPVLGASPGTAESFFARAAESPKLSVIGLRPPTLTRLGYAFATPGSSSRYAAYGESTLPSNRRSRLERNTAFSDLNYAVYLGQSARAQNLLVASLNHLPIRGRQAKLAIPFGNTYLTLVVAARQPLGGTLPKRLPWIIAIIGAVLALGAAALTLRLIQRRQAAEGLAGRLEQAVEENQRLYGEQRTIAQTLQHALLPEELPNFDGVEASARYEPGEQGVEIGGDWCDVIPLDDHRLLVVVGDVSGRGLRAAATMASLRYAIHAYAAENDPPATILAKLSKILSVTAGGQLATVLCAVADVDTRTITLASAGHLPPLMIDGDRGEFLESKVGLPIGVQADAVYTPRTVEVPAGATLLAFTDGLVERRGESLDSGLERLRAAAIASHIELPQLLGRLLSELRRGRSDDDTAIVGVRWKT